MARTSIPERVLRKVEKGSSRLATLVSKLRRALEPQSIARAERELATSYMLEIYGADRMVALGISPEESDAIACVAIGNDYREDPGPTYEAEAKPFRSAAESNAAYFAEEEAARKKLEGGE